MDTFDTNPEYPLVPNDGSREYIDWAERIRSGRLPTKNDIVIPAIPEDSISGMLFQPDAEAKTRELARQEFDQENAAIEESALLQIESDQPSVDAIEADRQKVIDQLDATDPHVTVPVDKRRGHITLVQRAILILGTLVGLIGFGVVNNLMVSNLIASGKHPDFIEDPSKAFLYAFVGITGLCLAKLGSDLFPNDAGRKRYIFNLWRAAVGAAGLWLILFSYEYGAAITNPLQDAINSVDVDGTSNKTTLISQALIFSQFAAEMLGGAAIFIMVVARLERHTETETKPNSESVAYKQSLEDCSKNPTRLRVAALRGFVTEMRTARQLFESRCVSRFETLRQLVEARKHAATATIMDEIRNGQKRLGSE